MEKYKICPVCGTHNNPLFLECSDCETDLQNVPVVDEAMENTPPVEPASSAPMVRICDCGEKNPMQARRCSACGEDISMVMPTADTQPEPQQFVLTSLDGGYAYEVAEGTCIIGRGQEMGAYLASKSFVSRVHAQLSREDGKLTIRDCGAVNGIFVNNQRIPAQQCVQLQDGDQIGLGGNEQNGTRQSGAAYFQVRICPCT